MEAMNGTNPQYEALMEMMRTMLAKQEEDKKERDELKAKLAELETKKVAGRGQSHATGSGSGASRRKPKVASSGDEASSTTSRASRKSKAVGECRAIVWRGETVELCGMSAYATFHYDEGKSKQHPHAHSLCLCEKHKEQYDFNPEPFHYDDEDVEDEDGNKGKTGNGLKVGLFYGYVPDGEELDFETVRFMDDEGFINASWTKPEVLKRRLAIAKAEGHKYHKNCPNGHNRWTKPGSMNKKPKAEKAEKPKPASRVRKASGSGRPKSAYYLFSDEVRARISEDVRKECSDKTHAQRLGETARRIKAEWETLTDEEKKPFFEKEQELKDAHKDAKEKKEMNAGEQAVVDALLQVQREAEDKEDVETLDDDADDEEEKDEEEKDEEEGIEAVVLKLTYKLGKKAPVTVLVFEKSYGDFKAGHVYEATKEDGQWVPEEKALGVWCGEAPEGHFEGTITAWTASKLSGAHKNLIVVEKLEG